MKLPANLQQLCEQYLEKLRQDSAYQLSDKDRWSLYQEFGFSRILNGQVFSTSDFTIADFVLSWLAFLTAQKVAFICDRGAKLAGFTMSEAAEVKNILKTAEYYLNSKITHEEAAAITDEYGFYYRPHIGYDVQCAWETSMVRFYLV